MRAAGTSGSVNTMIRKIARRWKSWWNLPTEVAELRSLVEETRRVVLQLNHDVHSTAEPALPLFVGFAERLRLDADTAIAATQVIERQLAAIDARIAALAEHG